MRGLKEITVQQVQQSIENGDKLNLIDVREVVEIQGGHIPGIINIPLGLLEFRLHELNKDTPYIMICRSGGRSGQATEFLTYHGYDATNMVGGMLAWEDKFQ